MGIFQNSIKIGLANPNRPSIRDFYWDDWLAVFVDDKFSLWWAPIYIMDNIFTRFVYLTTGTSDLYFTCGVFEGYHVDE